MFFEAKKQNYVILHRYAEIHFFSWLSYAKITRRIANCSDLPKATRFARYITAMCGVMTKPTNAMPTPQANGLSLAMMKITSPIITEIALWTTVRRALKCMTTKQHAPKAQPASAAKDARRSKKTTARAKTKQKNIAKTKVMRIAHLKMIQFIAIMTKTFAPNSTASVPVARMTEIMNS